MKILFINPVPRQCGIWQFGHRIYKHLSASNKWDIVFKECSDLHSLNLAFDEVQPDVTLYSTNSTTVPGAYNSGITSRPGVHIGLSHEAEQTMMDKTCSFDTDYFNGSAFPYWVGFDPQLVIKSDNCFSVTRPITRTEYIEPPKDFTVGCQCFGFTSRGHVSAIRAIQDNYDNAIIRFNSPASYWGDPQCNQAKQVVEECRRIITKPGIKLEATHTFFDTEEEIISWVQGNSANIYFYDQWEVPSRMRGVASSPDLSIAAQRPIFTNNCSMFRHLHPYFGFYPQDGTLPKLYDKAIENKISESLYNSWTPDRMVSEFEAIFEKVIK